MIFSFHKKNKTPLEKGFTLIELVVTLGIFAFMTAFLAFKYGTFSQGILVTNLAYDIALTIRQAQSYGINVEQATLCSGNSVGVVSNQFQCAYGVYLSSAANENTKFVFFVDLNSNSRYDADNNEELSIYTIKRNNFISSICMHKNNPCPPGQTTTATSIMFKRPDPSALIRRLISSSTWSTTIPYIRITVESPDGSQKSIITRSTGQISIEN